MKDPLLPDCIGLRLTCVIFHHVVVVTVGGRVGQIHGGPPRKKMTKLSGCRLHRVSHRKWFNSQNLFSQFQTLVFFLSTKPKTFFSRCWQSRHLKGEKIWRRSTRRWSRRAAHGSNKKLYQSSTTRRPFLWPTKGNKSGQLGKKEKFSVPVCSRRMLPTDEKISRRLVVISEQATTFPTSSFCPDALYLCNSPPSVFLTRLLFFVMLMCLLSWKKLKRQKPENEKEKERTFIRLKSAKTRLAQLRSAENQFHILTLSRSLLSLSLSLFNSLLGFSLHLGHASPSITNQGLLEGTQIFFQLSHFSAPFNGQCNSARLCIGPPPGDVTRGGGA